MSSFGTQLDKKFCNIFLYNSIFMVIGFSILLIQFLLRIINKNNTKNKISIQDNFLFMITLILTTITPYITNRLFYNMCINSLD
jgi:multisubunit Na+/H+ antiporter MnhF subunit